ncbi:MAG: SPFH domain-containing protein [Victivallaceae bacterium]|nr:SPFH domain-containing protein [Victivallaceae bacterium]MDD3117227.1 SPFH domain-containing protein [Victivallaceae bacterium]MDD4318507.1 SPFH domain-containing protein [Victivallaceae bacterium]MDD5663469.1 SPFH domain-containing protein [Victivallaceae bacterium]NLK83966.1 DUF4339 domain-containing protein [Lentisphaerota bacterium]
MGLFDIFKGQFIDIVEWSDENPNILVHRFDRHNHEIKMGAKLIVRPGQKAIFVNEGRIADHFTPGTYTLHTKNLPILTSLLSLPYNFQSPFKAEVYFVRTTEQLNRKWGTATPVMMRDKEFGIIRLRARGNFSYRVGESNDLLARFVGARAEFSCDDIEGQMKAKVVSAISDALGELKIAALDLASMYNEIGGLLHKNLETVFVEQGFDLISFTVENISLPDEVNAAMDKRSSLGALNGVMGQYTQLQAADAMRAAADNSGGAGNMMGVLMGAQLGNTAGTSVQQSAATAPPPLPASKNYFIVLNGQQSGPFDIETLKIKAMSGEINSDTLVWCNGMSNWQPAGTVSEIAAIFARVPPPIPPQ